MRLFKGDYYNKVLEFFNGFESFDFNQADQLANDGWSMGGTKANWNVVTQNGSQSGLTGSNSFNQDDGGGINIYRSITAGKSFEIQGYFYHKETVGGELGISSFFQVDDGDGDDGIDDPNNYIRLMFDSTNDGATQSAFQVRTKFGGSATTEHTSAYTLSLSNTWVGFRFKFTATTYYVYLDVGNTSIFVLYKSGAFTNTGTLANMDVFRHTADGTASDDPSVEIDNLSVYSLGASSAQEIPVTEIQCNKAEKGQGAFRATLRDFELANISTYENFNWSQCLIYTDDLSRVLFEGYITRTQIFLNQIVFSGIETLATLYKRSCETNNLLAAGEVTAINNSEITDSVASFTDALLTKPCVFTDKAGPSNTTHWPSAGDTYESDMTTGFTPYYEDGDYTDLIKTTDLWTITTATSSDYDDFAVIATYSVTNAATSSGLEFEIIFDIYNLDGYSVWPKFKIYNYNLTSWETIKTFSSSDFSDVDFPYHTSGSVVLTDAALDRSISEYFSGTEMKLAITSGTYSLSGDTRKYMRVYRMKVINTYSTSFAASGTIYTIDARTGTTLTFTGQNPETDGVGVGDRYMVGDTLNNCVDNIWDDASITDLVYDMDTTAEIDAADRQSEYIGNVLDQYATQMGVYFWQAVGTIVKLTSTLDDTEIDLTESDICDIRTIMLKDMDAKDLYCKVKLYGDGVYAEAVGSPDANSPQTYIYSGSLPSQQSAESFATNLADEKDVTATTYPLKINLSQSITNKENLDIMKTIDVNLYSGTITITAGIIKAISYSQEAGGDLFAELIITDA